MTPKEPRPLEGNAGGIREGFPKRYYERDMEIRQEYKEMATHSSVLAWRIPGMGEPGGLPSMGLQRVGHD